MNLTYIDAFFNSKEGKASIEKFRKSEAIRKAILEKRIASCNKRFPNRESFEKVLIAVCNKYSSKEYNTKEMRLGYEPRTDLLYIALQYARKHGRFANRKEIKRYGCMFTTELHIIHGFAFDLIQGQGSAVRVFDTVNRSRIF